jgi:hypothetical protein
MFSFDFDRKKRFWTKVTFEDFYSHAHELTEVIQDLRPRVVIELVAYDDLQSYQDSQIECEFKGSVEPSNAHTQRLYPPSPELRQNQDRDGDSYLPRFTAGACSKTL